MAISLPLRGNHSFLAFLISPGNGHFSSPPGDSSFIPTIHKNNQTTKATQPGILMRPEGLTSRRYLPTASPEAYVTQRASSRAERRPTGRIKNKPARGGLAFLALLLPPGDSHSSSSPWDSSIIPTIRRNNQTTKATHPGFPPQPSATLPLRLHLHYNK